MVNFNGLEDCRVPSVKTSHICLAHPSVSGSVGPSMVFALLHNSVTHRKSINM